MTTPQQTPRIAADPPGVGTPDVAACPACPHLLAKHDAIGTRFCRATTAKTLSRGCACAKH
jgi:hypothetical protein